MQSKKNRAFYLLGWGVLLIILLTPRINNHTETEDAYQYAQQVRDTDDWAQLIHPNHKLYHIICDEVHSFVNVFAVVEPLSTLIGISTICALASIACLYFFLVKIGLTHGKSLLVIAILSVTYNFWRYTHAAEINAMAWFGQSLFLLTLMSSRHSKGLFWPLTVAIIGVSATLVHTICIVPTAVIGVGYYFFSKRYRSLFVFVAALGVATFASFYTVDRYQQQNLNIVEGLTKSKKETPLTKKENAKNLTLKSFPKAAVGLGASVVGTNLIMGFDRVYDLLSNGLFRERYLYEERFMAQGTPLWHKVGWISMLVALFIVGGGILLTQLKKLTLNKSFFRTLFDKPESAAIWIGSLMCTVFILWFEPGNPEMWALILPVILLPYLIFMGSASYGKLGGFYLFFTATNYLGGISLLSNLDRDYYYATLEPQLRDSAPGDLVLRNEKHSGIPRYLSYHYPNLKSVVFPVDLETAAQDDFIQNHLEQGRKVFIHQEITNDPKSLKTNLHQANLVFVPDRLSGGGQLKLKQ